MIKLISVIWIAVALIVTSGAQATSISQIDNLMIDRAAVAFGEQAPAYYGQSFVINSSGAQFVTLETVSFFAASSSGPGPTPFRLLIAEVGGATLDDLHPTKVLYESGSLVKPFDPTFPINQGIFNRFDIDVGGVLLKTGEQYAFILDAFSEYDGIGGSSGVAINDNYTDGTFFHFGGTPDGDRRDHFKNVDGWVNSPHDMAFLLTYVKVPEPASLGLMTASLLMFGVMMNRRRRSRESGQSRT